MSTFFFLRNSVHPEGIVVQFFAQFFWDGFKIININSEQLKISFWTKNVLWASPESEITSAFICSTTNQK